MSAKTFLKSRDEYDFVKAKQRASIKWLLAKAYNHKTPTELSEPFYKDHDDMDRLKPHIVRSLANAEFYCMSLSHLYGDPNLHSLNHCGIIQALARKGIIVEEPSDCALTETMLIQTTPIKLSVHMAVTEALMQLFVKDAVPIDRMTSLVKRFAVTDKGDGPRPGNQEEALLLWVNTCIESLNARIQLEYKDSQMNEVASEPRFPPTKSLSDLTNGLGLAAVISLYCPEELPWSCIAGLSSEQDGPTMADSLYNIQLILRFCRDSLPFNFCHLSLEDLVYLHDSVRQNALCFLADLFHNLEVKPIMKSIQLPGVKKDQVIEVLDPDMHRPASLKRLTSTNQDKSEKSPASASEETFTVQRGRGVPTLSSVGRTSSPGLLELDKHHKEKQNQDTKSEERGEASLDEPWSLLQQAKNIPVAGKPSESSSSRRTSIAGRRSRRNSGEDLNASQLSLENLGGSHNNLTLLGRNPDKEMKTHSGRKSDYTYSKNNDRFIDNKELDEIEKHQREGSPYGGKSERCSESPETKVSFADFRRQKARDQFHSSAINITYSEQEKEDTPKRSNLLTKIDSGLQPQKETQPAMANALDNSTDDMASQLNNVRLKLEQRRKRIEEEKRKMEIVMAKQREKELSEDLSAVQSRWLSDRNRPSGAPAPRTPDIEAMDMDTYTKSLTAMNDSLHELQTDIQRLAQQQSQIQQLMASSSPAGRENNHVLHHPMDPQPFYISSPEPQPPTSQRRTWGQPQPISFAHQSPPMDPSGWSRRQQWGMPQPQSRPMAYGFNQYVDHPYGPPPPIRDQWNHPSMYNGHYTEYNAYANPSYMSQNYGGASAMQPSFSSASNYMTPPPYGTNRSPFRLHEGPNAISPVATPLKQSDSTSHKIQSPTAYSRQFSRESVNSNSGGARNDLSGNSSTPHRPHSSIPAPEEDEMAPQNVSFIEFTDDEPELGKLSGRLSQLNISSGSKTYRVHSDKESSPSPTRNRPTISSTFKQQRKGSGGDTQINNSIRGVSDKGKTEEEVEALAAIKMVTLKDDASKGFVISFDDDTPKKPKPQLGQRRPSSNKNSVPSEMSSDGSSSSRKENVPPEVMICIDMNTVDAGADTRGVSPVRKYNSSTSRFRNGITDPASWRSYGDMDRASTPASAVPKFEVDPEIPLESMATLNTGNSESESDSGGRAAAGTGLLIGDELLHSDPSTLEEMQRKKERIMLQSLRRKQQAEENKVRKDEEMRLKRELESKENEEKQRKKEEEKARRETILQQFRLKKEQEKDESEDNIPEPVSARPVPKLRPKSASKPSARPRPKTIHVDANSDMAISSLPSSRGTRGSSSNISGSGMTRSESRNSVNRSAPNGSLSLASMGSGRPSVSSTRQTSRPSSRRGSSAFLDENPDEGSRFASNSRLRGSRESLQSGLTYSARRGSNASVYDDNDYYYGGSMRDLSSRHTGRRKSSSASHIEISYRSVAMAHLTRGNAASGLSGSSMRSISHLNSLRRGSGSGAAAQALASKMTKSRSIANLSGLGSSPSTSLRSSASRPDSGVGSLTTPRSVSSPRATNEESGEGPGSLPGYARRRGEYDDGASDISSTSGFSAYGYRSGTRLYREPASKSNRSIILNAIEYVVFPGVVNADTRNRVLDVIDRCDCPHFLLLFRDVKCQFRGLYAYYPDTEEVYKIYGTGPKQVSDNMFETFFKYNSGGKKFTKIHTKHLTVTIDAFTIHNSLWLGKKAPLPDRKDMALVV